MNDIFGHLRRNIKWYVAILFSIVFTGFAGEHSLWTMYGQAQMIRGLRKEIADYKDTYEKDSIRLELLKTDHDAVVEVARTMYFMKAEDEDIFIVEDE